MYFFAPHPFLIIKIFQMATKTISQTVKIYALKKGVSAMISILVNGVTKYIQFGGGNVYLGTTGIYRTSDNNIQKALESSSLFNRKYIIKETKFVKKEVPIEIPKEMTFGKVTDCVFFLKQTFGIKLKAQATRKECIDKGKELGVTIRFE